MAYPDTTGRNSVPIININAENPIPIPSDASVLEEFAEKVDVAVDKVAKERNLEKFIVFERLPPIDICVFGRSGIGKSQLIKAITHLDLPTSSQLDHVTQTLTEATTTIGPLQFRFWDTRGIDNWSDLRPVSDLFRELAERRIQPIFIIYCAAAGGRVDSEIVTSILKKFQMKRIPICYVITNIYAASSEQLGSQIEGGRKIMNEVFDMIPEQTGKFSYEYGNLFKNDKNLIPTRQGILIGVNSCPFNNIMGTMPIYNIHELMNFLAGNLNDEDFSKFVALTMNNRDFWDKISDGLRTRVKRASDTLSQLKIQTVSFFKRLFSREKIPANDQT